MKLSVQIVQSAMFWATRLLSMNGERFGISYSVKFHYKQSVYRMYALRNTVRVRLHSSGLLLSVLFSCFPTLRGKENLSVPSSDVKTA